MDLETKPLPSAIGREVVGLELCGEITPETAQALMELWLEVGVLVFRGLGDSPEKQLKLSRCFGELEPHPLEIFRMPGYPELILLTNRDGPVGPVYAYDGIPTYGRIPWHTDLAFTTTPNAGALLRMVQKTEHGGQTGWIDTALAYDELDEDTKAELEGLEVRFEFCADLKDMRFNNPGGERVGAYNPKFHRFPPVANPLVWTHPENGRKVLNLSTLNITRVIGMDEDKSDQLIQRLIDHALQPRFSYMHDWENNDMVLWDNRRTMHCATGHPMDEIRIVHRTTIKGTVRMGRVIEESSAAAPT